MIRVKLDAGEHRAVTDGGRPLEYVGNAGPGVVLIEGRTVRPGSGWAPDGWRATTVIVSTMADDYAEIEVR